MELRSDRLRNASETRAQLSSLLDDASCGQATHILRGSEVVGHLVPPNALVVDDERLLQAMIASAACAAIVNVAADRANSGEKDNRAAEGWIDVLAWLKPDHDSYIDGLTLYVAALRAHLGEHAALTVDTVLQWLGPGAAGVLGEEDTLRADISAALTSSNRPLEAALAAVRSSGRIYSPLVNHLQFDDADDPRISGLKSPRLHSRRS